MRQPGLPPAPSPPHAALLSLVISFFSFIVFLHSFIHSSAEDRFYRTKSLEEVTQQWEDNREDLRAALYKRHKNAVRRRKMRY